MSSQQQPKPDPKLTLAKAYLNAGKCLGLKQAELGDVLGKDRTTLSRGIDPDSKTGELALMLIRCYRGLFALLGGEINNMQHWMHTHNHHTQGIPAEQVKSIAGLLFVLEYIDAMRGKI